MIVTSRQAKRRITEIMKDFAHLEHVIATTIRRVTIVNACDEVLQSVCNCVVDALTSYVVPLLSTVCIAAFT